MRKRKFYLISSIFIVALCIILTDVCFQNDTFYSIKLGNLILNNGIDMLDHFSIHTLPYTYPHWLYDIMIYFIYNYGGYFLIYVANIVIYIVISIIIFYLNNKQTKSGFIALVYTILSVLLLHSYITARAQVVSYVIFILEYIFILRFLKNGKRRYLIGLLVLSLLLCNIHPAVWTFYYILYLPFIFEYLVAKLTHKKMLFKRIELDNNKNVKLLVVTMILSLITGLMTPIGDTPFTYFYRTSIGNSQGYIKEHLAPGVTEMVFLAVFDLEILILMLINKIKLRDICMVIGISFMAFTANRHIAFFPIFVLPIMAKMTDQVILKFNFNLDKYTVRFLTTKVGMVVIIGISGFLCYVTYSNYKEENLIPSDTYPVKAVTYIKEKMDYENIRLFNEYDYGSYLLLNDIPVFIDSRADLYTKPFNNKVDIFDDYMSSDYNYKEVFKKYDIDHIIVAKNKNLYDNLKGDDAYLPIYEDHYFVIYMIVEET